LCFLYDGLLLLVVEVLHLLVVNLAKLQVRVVLPFNPFYFVELLFVSDQKYDHAQHYQHHNTIQCVLTFWNVADAFRTYSVLAKLALGET
jgi:hypothetical protein